MVEDIARQVQVTAVTNEHCFLHNPEFARISSNRTFCAGGKGTSTSRDYWKTLSFYSFLSQGPAHVMEIPAEVSSSKADRLGISEESFPHRFLTATESAMSRSSWSSQMSSSILLGWMKSHRRSL